MEHFHSDALNPETVGRDVVRIEQAKEVPPKAPPEAPYSRFGARARTTGKPQRTNESEKAVLGSGADDAVRPLLVVVLADLN